MHPLNPEMEKSWKTHISAEQANGALGSTQGQARGIWTYHSLKFEIWLYHEGPTLRSRITQRSLRVIT